MQIYQSILLGILQGITELFPVSSLGHSIILPSLLGWKLDQNNQNFLGFLVITHLATAIVLFIFFYRDWIKIIFGIFISLKEREINSKNYYGKLGWLLIFGTIPAGILGILFEDYLKSLFGNPLTVSIFLILNGIVLFLAEILRRKKVSSNNLIDIDIRLSSLKWLDTLKIGTLQSLALLPGFSRTGAAMTGGLLVNLSHEDAARFSFLLATPIIFAAALLKIPELFFHASSEIILISLIGGISSGISAYLAISFLEKYFQTKTLIPFAIYCLFGGILAYLSISLR